MTRPRKEPKRKHPQTRTGTAILMTRDAVECERYGDHRSAANCRSAVRHLLQTVCVQAREREA